MPRPVEAAMRTQDCTACGAAPGERCVTEHGSNRSYAHPARYKAAVAAGLLPLPEDPEAAAAARRYPLNPS